MLRELQEIIATVAREVGPAVVGLGGRRGGGSGVVVAEGSVLTVAHALRDEEAEVLFADGRRAMGRVAGVDAQLGIALIAVDTGHVSSIVWAPEDTATTLGSAVLALADPGGRGLRVTAGFVSSAQGSLRGVRGRRIAGAIEHSAPLPRGSSGGPLVDLHGRLVGINAVRRDGGLIVALPADATLRERVERLRDGEGGQPRTLGVAVAPPRLARRMRHAVGLPEREGLLVRGVQDDTPAQRAGLARGDLLVSAGGRPLDGVDALYAALDGVDGEGAITLGVVRGTEERAVEVRFEPAEPSA